MFFICFTQYSPVAVQSPAPAMHGRYVVVCVCVCSGTTTRVFCRTVLAVSVLWNYPRGASFQSPLSVNGQAPILSS